MTYPFLPDTLMVMILDYFSNLILCPCPSKTTGNAFRPQLRGIVGSTAYLLDENGKEECFHDTAFVDEKALIKAWLTLHPEHTDSIAQKAWIISQLITSQSHDYVFEDVLDILEIPKQQHLFKMYRDVGSKLNKDFLIFAHDKQFSLKHCQSFTLMPLDTISTLLGFKDQLNLSASHFIELSELISDYARKTSVSTLNLLQKPPFLALFEDDTLTLHQRTEALKTQLKALRLPTLTKLNSQMSTLVQTLNLPKHASIQWDTTLENPGINLNVKLESQEDLTTFLTYLKHPNALSGMSDILELQ